MSTGVLCLILLLRGRRIVFVQGGGDWVSPARVPAAGDAAGAGERRGVRPAGRVGGPRVRLPAAGARRPRGDQRVLPADVRGGGGLAGAAGRGQPPLSWRWASPWVPWVGGFAVCGCPQWGPTPPEREGNETAGWRGPRICSRASPPK